MLSKMYAAEIHSETYHEDEGIGSCHQGHELSIGVLVVQHLQLLLPCLGCGLPPHCIVSHLHISLNVYTLSQRHKAIHLKREALQDVEYMVCDFCCLGVTSTAAM